MMRTLLKNQEYTLSVIPRLREINAEFEAGNLEPYIMSTWSIDWWVDYSMIVEQSLPIELRWLASLKNEHSYERAVQLGKLK